MENDYCPIKYRTLFRKNLCRATEEKCDHIQCVERIRNIGTIQMDTKYKEWREHRRGEPRGGKLAGDTPLQNLGEI